MGYEFVTAVSKSQLYRKGHCIVWASTWKKNHNLHPQHSEIQKSQIVMLILQYFELFIAYYFVSKLHIYYVLA